MLDLATNDNGEPIRLKDHSYGVLLRSALQGIAAQRAADTFHIASLI